MRLWVVFVLLALACGEPHYHSVAVRKTNSDKIKHALQVHRDLEVFPSFLTAAIAKLLKKGISTVTDQVSETIKENIKEAIELYITRRVVGSGDCLQKYFFMVLDRGVILLIETVLAVLAAIGSPLSLAATLPDVFLQLSELTVTLPHLVSALGSANDVRKQCDKASGLLQDAFLHRFDLSNALEDYEKVTNLRNDLANKGMATLISQVQRLKTMFADFVTSWESISQKFDYIKNVLAATVKWSSGKHKKDQQILLQGCVTHILDPLDAAVGSLQNRVEQTQQAVSQLIETDTTPSVTLDHIVSQGLETVLEKVRTAAGHVRQITTVSAEEISELLPLFSAVEDRRTCPDTDGVFQKARKLMQELLEEFNRAKLKLSAAVSWLQIYLRAINMRKMRDEIEFYQGSLAHLDQIMLTHKSELEGLNTRLVELAENTREKLATHKLVVARASENPMFRFLERFLELLDSLRASFYQLAEQFIPKSMLGELEPSLLESQRATTNALSEMFDEATTWVAIGAMSPAHHMKPNRWDADCGYAYSRVRSSYVVVEGWEPVWAGSFSAGRYRETSCDGPAIFSPDDEALKVTTVEENCRNYKLPDPEISLGLFGDVMVNSEIDDSDALPRPHHRLQRNAFTKQIDLMAEVTTAALQCYAFGGFGIDAVSQEKSDRPTATLSHVISTGSKLENAFKWYVLGIRPGPVEGESYSEVEEAIVPGCIMTHGESCVWVMVIHVNAHHIRRFKSVHKEEQPLRMVDKSTSKTRHEVLTLVVKNEDLLAWACSINRQLVSIQENKKATIKRRPYTIEYLKGCEEGKVGDDEPERFEDKLQDALTQDPITRDLMRSQSDDEPTP